MEISLTKLPWYAQIGAFVALAGAGVFVFYTYYEKPVREEMTGREKQLTLIKKDITTGRSTARKLDEFRTQVDDLEARLAGLRAVLPEEKDAADLLRSMQTVALQSNLTIKAFKPAEPVMKQLHAEWPIELEIEGTYHNLAVFFDRIGHFTRIVNVSGLAIEGKAKPSANVTISAKCVATTFVLMEAPKPPAKGGKSGKSGKPPEAAAKGAA